MSLHIIDQGTSDNLSIKIYLKQEVNVKAKRSSGLNKWYHNAAQ